MRHLINLGRFNHQKVPEVVAELGPGDSVGAGLAALLSGVKEYYAFDVVPHALSHDSVAILEELITLFKSRAPIPDQSEFPFLKPFLEDYSFPSHILTDEILKGSLSEESLSKLRKRLAEDSGAPISYVAPWDKSHNLKKESVDFIFSQAVMEHVDDLQDAYQSMNQWLKVGGHISHQIDFKCHSTADQWNGHWTYSDFIWRLMRGTRPYLINRQPISVHENLVQKNNFSSLVVLKNKMPSELTRKDLAPLFKNLTDEDLETSGAYLLARR